MNAKKNRRQLEVLQGLGVAQIVPVPQVLGQSSVSGDDIDGKYLGQSVFHNFRIFFSNLYKNLKSLNSLNLKRKDYSGQCASKRSKTDNQEI